jgi:hypothetical protein
MFGSGFGHDQVTDFTLSGKEQDFLVFSKSLFNSAADVLGRTDDLGAGGYARIVYDADNSVTLTGIHKSDLTAGDFLFS